MIRPKPPLPEGCPARFRATVHGTVFGERSSALEAVEPGDELYLIPDPPGTSEPEVWVHLPGGTLVGHLPPEIGAWLAPWMLRGGGASARALKVGGADVPSWRRLLLEVRCAV
ncbi:MAG: hypothetical protein D6701_05730 [Gemmatimonadetes bacterium]|nr:MAG: hypothetical protein D6701_05730 [Gemmatimonadota bacterium]